MWLRDHPHGSVLVHRVYASGCHRPPAGHTLPDDGHHEGRQGTVIIYFFILSVPRVVCRESPLITRREGLAVSNVNKQSKRETLNEKES